jgi:hypothetical protein
MGNYKEELEMLIIKSGLEDRIITKARKIDAV